MSQYAKKRNQLKENMAKLWGVIMGQCTKALVEALRAEHDFEQEQVAYNSIMLVTQEYQKDCPRRDNILKHIIYTIPNSATADCSLISDLSHLYLQPPISATTRITMNWQSLIQFTFSC